MGSRNFIIFIATIFYVVGCASVPMDTIEADNYRKKFSPPSQGNAGIYIYRDFIYGGAVTKSLYIDDKLIGSSAPFTFFYKEVKSGDHKISTESEFGNNDLILHTESGNNYFIRQYIRMGVLLTGGANIELMTSDEGMAGVLRCKLAK